MADRHPPLIHWCQSCGLRATWMEEWVEPTVTITLTGQVLHRRRLVAAFYCDGHLPEEAG